MSDPTVRCWLVERDFGARNIVTLVYATPDGSQYHQRERSSTALRTGPAVTAATDVPESDLEPVDDAETRERYATEVDRVQAQYEPDDSI
ncbi:hypothetical protein [Natrialba asiatica]|uniref:DUF7967 domain-containing protein n=1 Tax=Natrialba asiatica (strain ATCC 700177 / DSM 12278 / JCM 9576 / FERM P-10747 / NBRC 102637 / 172P1) TaxID=29540 RepID=M0AJD6_NATA1|nr:hypothetical protein [Natrialba asiatica]ELY98486.1 hypothetical protein C481_17692 [Natrialba asiatica DSM 12278]